ncbi:MAG: phosphatidate cytidylyltransferase, partial [Firmicutes bacterium]|nr:phosphatidate cytidylyltransferase [Bacillota bacterium]
PMMVIVAITVVLGFVVYYLVHFLIPFPGGGISAYIAVLALMFLVAIIYNMFSKKHSMPNVLSTMFVLVYPATIGVYMLALNYLPQGNLPQGRTVSNAAILLLFLIPALADTFAYFVGSLFKGPKLAPSISPKKTISGAVGGILGGVAAGAIVLALSFISGSPIAIGRQPGGVNIAHFLVMGGVGAIFVILGDLLASYVKRQCDIKDFGKILPGHGGILDRVDGMLLCGVFLFVYFYVLNFSWAY